MRDRPADNRELLGPQTRRNCSSKIPMELTIESPKLVTISVRNPARGLPLESLPIFIAGVSVAEFRRVYYPSQSVVS